MNDMKKLFKERSFVINPNILKNIKNLNITLNEFLLILYFINIDNVLDIENIEKLIGLNPEEILNTYSELITKGLINTIVTKEDGKVNESIDLDMFYDKLIMSQKEEKKESKDIFECFENEFGRSLSPIEYETINNWISNGVSEDTIKSALKEAVINGVSNLRYIDKIIYEWTKKGNKPNIEEDFKPLFDYNWLDDEDYEE